LGSCAEYAGRASDDGKPWPETRMVAPATPYGQAKADLHQRLATLCEMTPGASLVWARLFHLYGPGEPQSRLVPSLVASLAAGRPAEVHAAGLVRDFASTEHIARSVVALLNSQARGHFNLGSGTSVTLGQVAQTIADHFGRPDLLRLSHDPPPHEPLVMVPDLSRLAAATGFCIEDPRKRLPHLIASLQGEGFGRS
jgi:nucleoside-diphosphate-sugar epimerase